jgi:hypothetical protein
VEQRRPWAAALLAGRPGIWAGLAGRVELPIALAREPRSRHIRSPPRDTRKVGLPALAASRKGGAPQG